MKSEGSFSSEILSKLSGDILDLGLKYKLEPAELIVAVSVIVEVVSEKLGIRKIITKEVPNINKEAMN